MNKNKLECLGLNTLISIKSLFGGNLKIEKVSSYGIDSFDEGVRYTLNVGNDGILVTWVYFPEDQYFEHGYKPSDDRDWEIYRVYTCEDYEEFGSTPMLQDMESDGYTIDL